MNGATAGNSAGCGSLRGLPLVSAKSPACVTKNECTRQRSSWRRNFGGSVCGGMTYYVSEYTTQDLSQAAHADIPQAVPVRASPYRREIRWFTFPFYTRPQFRAGCRNQSPSVWKIDVPGPMHGHGWRSCPLLRRAGDIRCAPSFTSSFVPCVPSLARGARIDHRIIKGK